MLQLTFYTDDKNKPKPYDLFDDRTWPTTETVFGVTDSGFIIKNPPGAHQAIMEYENGQGAGKWQKVVIPLQFPEKIRFRENDLETVENIEIIRGWMLDKHHAKAFQFYDDYKAKNICLLLAFGCSVKCTCGKSDPDDCICDLPEDDKKEDTLLLAQLGEMETQVKKMGGLTQKMRTTVKKRQWAHRHCEHRVQLSRPERLYGRSKSI